MKTRFLIITSVLILIPMQLVYGPPAPDHESAFDYAEHVIIGKILSVEILSVPNKDPSVPNGFALYEIQVEEYLKNPLDADIIKVPGAYVYEKISRGTTDLLYEVNQRVFLYIQKDYPNIFDDYDLIIRGYESRVLDEPLCGLEATYQEGKCVIDKTGMHVDPSRCWGHACNFGFISPLKQFKLGIIFDEIQCRDSLVLLQKYDGSPACVKPASISKLIERNWANGIKIENEWTASYYPNGRSLPDGTFDTNLENVVPWLMMQELEQHGVKNWRNDPSTGAHTDEGWLNPSKMCSSLLVDAKTKLYVSSTFYSEPTLSVSEIIIDDSKPTECQKWFSVPYGVDSETGNLLYDYDEKSKNEHYEIDIIGLKDEYVLGEEYSFYFIISGYGYSCANYDVKYPDENGNTIAMGVEVLCESEQHMTEFEINHLERKGTIGNIGIQNSGTYTITVTFEKPNQYFPTSVSKTFEVVE